MSITEKLNKIKSCKENIKQAIIDKGVDMTDVAFTEYATKIGEIQAGGGDYLDMRMNMSTYYSTAEKVGSCAFAYCSSLQSINLPMCSSVGSSAFAYCSSLQSINLPMCSSVGGAVFQNCSSLQSVNLPKIVSTTGSMFERCTSLQSVDLPMCKIVGDSFEHCSSLTSVNISKCVSISAYAFSGCINLPSLYIPFCICIGGNYIFQNCSSLSVLDLRSTYSCVLSNSNAFSKTPFASGIGSIYVHVAHLSQFQTATNWAYYSNCFVGVGDPTRPLLSFDSGRVYGDTYILGSNYLSYFNIKSSSVIEIDLPYLEGFDTSYFSFAYYSNLREVKLNNIKSISALFSGCTSLQSVNLPNCSYVGDDAFHACTSLTSIDLPNCSYVGNRVFRICTSLQSVNIPMCEYVGNYAFVDCKLQSIDLPNCSYVGNEAFSGCKSLQSVNLPNCSCVNYHTFNFCSSLQSVNLPNCSSIGSGAFYGCYSLSTIYIGTSISTVCEIINDTFTLTNSSFSVFVPMSLVDAYKSARIWSNYASQIYGV